MSADSATRSRVLDVIYARRKIDPADRVPSDEALIAACDECNERGLVLAPSMSRSHPGYTLRQCSHFHLLARALAIVEGVPGKARRDAMREGAAVDALKHSIAEVA